MSCPACEKRQAQEQRQLSDCEGRCKEMAAKNQKLSLALAVVGTLVGKESLDFALGLSTTLSPVAAATSAPPPFAESGPVVVAQSSPEKPEPKAPELDLSSYEVLFPDLPALTPALTMPGYQASDKVFDLDLYTGDSNSFVPESGALLLFGLTAIRPRRRK